MENLQFLNGGMHKDNDLSMQPKNTYREANNGYLISGDGDFYTFVSAKGNKLSFSLPATHSDHIIIGWVASLNDLYIFTTANEGDSGGVGTIWKVAIDESGMGVPTRLYEKSGLNFTTKWLIFEECVFIEESDSIARLYWTDNFNSPRSLNVFTPVDPNTGLIETDVKLLDLTPTLDPNEIRFLSTENPQPTPNSDIPSDGKISGDLPSATFRYIWQFVSTKINYKTAWAPISAPIIITPEDASENKGDWSNVSKYQAFQGGDTDEDTSKAIAFTISNIDTLFDNIRIAAFKYNGVDTNPNGRIFIDEPITNSTMTFVHRSEGTLGIVTPNDVLVPPADIERVKTLATNKNRLMYGNITESDIIDISELAKDIVVESSIYTSTSLAYRRDIISSDPDVFKSASVSYPQVKPLIGHAGWLSHGFPASYTPSTLPTITNAGYIFPGQWYGVHASGGGEIEYPAGSGQKYTKGMYFKGIANEETYNITQSFNGYLYPVAAYIIVRKFGNVGDPNKLTVAEARRHHTIRLRSDFSDMKGVLSNAYVKGYWRKETYRMAIMLWDKKMRPLFAYHIDDKVMPAQDGTTDIGGSASLQEIGTDNYALKTLYMRLRNIDLNKIVDALDLNDPKDLINIISGFSIVRAKRDASILMQGIILPTVKIISNIDSEWDDRVMPLSMDRIGSINSSTAIFGRVEKTYTFHSPEHLFNWKGLYNETTQPLKPKNRYLSKNYMFKGIKKNQYGYLKETHDVSNIPPNYGQGHYIPLYLLGAPTGTPPGSYDRQRIKSSYNMDSPDSTPKSEYDPSNPTRKFYNMISYGGFPVTAPSTLREGYGMKTRVLVLENDFSLPPSVTYQSVDKIYSCNIEEPINQPYGGTSESSLSNTEYMTTGHFQPITMDVYNELIAENPLSVNAPWIFNNVDIFGGDCFLNYFDIVKDVANSGIEPLLKGFLYGAVSILFPVESNINVALRQGRHVARDGTKVLNPSYGQDGVSSDNIEDFIYNEAYSHDAPNILYPAKPNSFIPKKKYSNRVRYSFKEKVSNEPDDSFRTFEINDFRDVNIQNGGITNLRVKGEKLFYWQDKAVGYLPINERITLGTALGAPVQLGIGGVMTRYDERTDFYGNQHRHGLIETPDGFVWIDRNNRVLLNMKTSGQFVELSSIKGIMSMIDPLVKGTIDDNPISRTLSGFLGSYDARTKNTYLSFIERGIMSTINDGEFRPGQGGIETIMFLSEVDITNVSNGDIITICYFDRRINQEVCVDVTVHSVGSDYININAIELELGQSLEELDNIEVTFVEKLGTTTTIAFNHLNNKFVGLFSFGPSMYLRFKDFMLTVPHISKGQRSKMYTHDEGSLGEYYGKTYDTDIELVVTPGVDPVVFNNVEVSGDDEAFTSILYKTSFQSALDLDIENNEEYEFRNRQWLGTVPLDEDARMRDKYMTVKFIKDNAQEPDRKIKLISLKTIYEKTY